MTQLSWVMGVDFGGDDLRVEGVRKMEMEFGGVEN